MDVKRDSEDISLGSETRIRLSRIRYCLSFVLAICSWPTVSISDNDKIFDKFPCADSINNTMDNYY